jgi:hypothetical protein
MRNAVKNEKSAAGEATPVIARLIHEMKKSSLFCDFILRRSHITASNDSVIVNNGEENIRKEATMA